VVTLLAPAVELRVDAAEFASEDGAVAADRVVDVAVVVL
jgi:hypothetical protein